MANRTTQAGAARARFAWCAFAVAGFLLLNAVLAGSLPASHDRSFWLSLRAGDFKLTQDQSVLPLTLEAAALLGSTDPELRDGVAYEALAAWVYRDRRLDSGDRPERSCERGGEPAGP